tara:strand:+ start:397 stop:513 length:117 start_codon:yes stop_codon:yes gene_type:complete
VDAIRFCEEKREELLMLLDESYRLMLEDFNKAKEATNV